MLAKDDGGTTEDVNEVEGGELGGESSPAVVGLVLDHAELPRADKAGDVEQLCDSADITVE